MYVSKLFGGNLSMQECQMLNQTKKKTHKQLTRVSSVRQEAKTEIQSSTRPFPNR